MLQAKRGVKIIVSFCGQWWALTLTDEVGVWDSSVCDMPGRVALVNKTQLGWIPTRIGKQPIDVVCRHPVTMCMASLQTLSMRQVCTL